MKRKHPEEYLYIFREFEAVKRTVYTDKDDKVKMAIPRTFLDNICNEHLKKDFNAVVRSSPYQDKMILRNDKMIIDANLIIDMFK